MKEIRLLTPEDIDVRVAQTTANDNAVKVSLLLYKDARVDMRILDELFTPTGWQRAHRIIGDRLYCQVSVWDEDKRIWVTKEDVGTESNTEAEKGQASDSFKRACFNWGIGRELYTAPKISVELNTKEYSKDNSGRVRVWASFSVSEIGYDDNRNINRLVIVDRFGKVRYKMGEKAEASHQIYTPMNQEAYWNIIREYALGHLTKQKGDYRQTWIDYTHADKEAIEQFDSDVNNYRTANNL